MADTGTVTTLVELDHQLEARSPDVAAELFLLRFSGHTAAAYRTDLKLWAEWLERHGFDPFTVNRSHVQLFIREQAGAPATVARRLACLSSFYRFCEQEGFVDRSPLEGVRRPRASSVASGGLSKHELRSLLRAAEASGALEHALVCLLALNGLRIGSVVALNRADLGQDRGFRVVTVRGKGGKVQQVPLCDRTWRAVSRLLDVESDVSAGSSVCPAVTHSGLTSGPGGEQKSTVRAEVAGWAPVPRVKPLFVAPGGKRLDRWQALRIVKRLARHAGVPPITPHSLRATFVTLALEHGAPLHEVQEACAHASPVTTEIYNRARLSLDRNPTFILSRAVCE